MAATNASPGAGCKIYYDPTAGGSPTTQIAEVDTIKIPGSERSVIEIKNLDADDDHIEVIGGHVNATECVFGVHVDLSAASHEADTNGLLFLSQLAAEGDGTYNAKCDWKISLNDNGSGTPSYAQFVGLLRGFDWAEVGEADAIHATITVKPSGKVTYSVHA